MGEQESTMQLPAPEDVWRWIPGNAGGPAWRALIEDAIRRLDDARRYEEELDLDELPHTFGDEMSVYTVDKVRGMYELDLWANQSVEDEVEELGGVRDAIRDDGTADWDQLCGVYLYAARRMVMRAVLQAAQHPARSCDRCHREHGWHELMPMLSAGFDLLCIECATAVRQGQDR